MIYWYGHRVCLCVYEEKIVLFWFICNLRPFPLEGTSLHSCNEVWNILHMPLSIPSCPRAGTMKWLNRGGMLPVVNNLHLLYREINFLKIFEFPYVEIFAIHLWTKFSPLLFKKFNVLCDLQCQKVLFLNFIEKHKQIIKSNKLDYNQLIKQLYQSAGCGCVCVCVYKRDANFIFFEGRESAFFYSQAMCL